jgi:hypothetical protein
MEKYNILELPSFNQGIHWIQNNPIKSDKIFMGNRVCDNCGKTKDTYGGKTCSHGHFICHSCVSGHEHCPLCGHTLR